MSELEEELPPDNELLSRFSATELAALDLLPLPRFPFSPPLQALEPLDFSCKSGDDALGERCLRMPSSLVNALQYRRPTTPPGAEPLPNCAQQRRSSRFLHTTENDCDSNRDPCEREDANHQSTPYSATSRDSPLNVSKHTGGPVNPDERSNADRLSDDQLWLHIFQRGGCPMYPLYVGVASNVDTNREGLCRESQEFCERREPAKSAKIGGGAPELLSTHLAPGNAPSRSQSPCVRDVQQPDFSSPGSPRSFQNYNPQQLQSPRIVSSASTRSLSPLPIPDTTEASCNVQLFSSLRRETMYESFGEAESKLKQMAKDSGFSFGRRDIRRSRCGSETIQMLALQCSGEKKPRSPTGFGDAKKRDCPVLVKLWPEREHGKVKITTIVFGHNHALNSRSESVGKSSGHSIRNGAVSGRIVTPSRKRSHLSREVDAAASASVRHNPRYAELTARALDFCERESLSADEAAQGHSTNDQLDVNRRTSDSTTGGLESAEKQIRVFPPGPTASSLCAKPQQISAGKRKAVPRKSAQTLTQETLLSLNVAGVRHGFAGSAEESRPIAPGEYLCTGYRTFSPNCVALAFDATVGTGVSFHGRGADDHGVFAIQGTHFKNQFVFEMRYQECVAFSFKGTLANDVTLVGSCWDQDGAAGKFEVALTVKPTQIGDAGPGDNSSWHGRARPREASFDSIADSVGGSTSDSWSQGEIDESTEPFQLNHSSPTRTQFESSRTSTRDLDFRDYILSESRVMNVTAEENN